MNYRAPLLAGLLASTLVACSGEGGSSSSTSTTTTEGPTGSASTSTTTTASIGAGGSVACPAGESLALAATGADTPDGAGVPETVITIENVGGTGTYPRVTLMNPGTFGEACPSDACVKTDTPVSGPLAPFDDEITPVFRGPMELYDISVYAPSGPDWARVSWWNRCGEGNIVFVNNKGGDASGVWTPCGGNSQSYATADGKEGAASKTTFSGTLDNEIEINALTEAPCSGSDDASACGFSRGVALHGWAGAKAFVVRARMPRYTGPKGASYTDAPAYWMLNARIVRTAQYGCNCRGVGSPGGCGELDVAEVLEGAHLGHATSTVYSFQGAIGADGVSGAGHYFVRPVHESAVFVVLFDAQGRIQMLRKAPDAFDFGPVLPAATVAAWSAEVGFSMALP